MVDVSCYNGQNGAVSTIDVDPTPFGTVVRKRLMRQAYIHYQAARRLGTHSTLTRAEVNYTERRPWRQKGTGRARAGDFSSPLWRGGGVVFGPKPRSYTTRFSRRMRKEALRSALLGRLSDGGLKLLEAVTFASPKTKDAVHVLEQLGIDRERTTIVIAERGENFHKSFRNLRWVDTQMASDLNAEHVLDAPHLIFDRKAFEIVLKRLGDA